MTKNKMVEYDNDMHYPVGDGEFSLSGKYNQGKNLIMQAIDEWAADTSLAGAEGISFYEMAKRLIMSVKQDLDEDLMALLDEAEYDEEDLSFNEEPEEDEDEQFLPRESIISDLKKGIKEGLISKEEAKEILKALTKE